MEHGRDHDNRSVHRTKPRANNTPPDLELEDESQPGTPTRGAEGGSRPAPTRRAAEREAERHRLERERGHVPAGDGGARRASGEADRRALEEAAREADLAVETEPTGR